MRVVRVVRVAALAAAVPFLATCSDATATQALVDFLLGYCSTPPVFVAVKNGDGAWEPVTLDATGNATVKVAEKFGVASVTQNSSGGYFTSVAYLARSEGPTAAPTCPATGTKTVNGSISTLPSNNEAQVQLGNRSAFLFTGGATTFSITSVRSGPQDLLAQRRSTTTGLADKVIIRRAQDITAGATMTQLDFGGTEAVTPASGAVTITGAGTSGSRGAYSILYTPSNIGSYFFFNSPNVTSTAATVYGLPSAQAASTDMNVISIYETVSGAATTTERGVDTFKRNIAAFAAAFGPAISTLTVTVVTSSPKVLRLQLASQSDYGKVVEFYYYQGTGSTFRSMDIITTAGYLGATPTTWDIQPPDLSGVSGYPAAAAFASTAISYWDVWAQGDVADWFKHATDVVDGTVSKWAEAYSSGTTGLLLAPETVESSLAQGPRARRAAGLARLRMSPR